MTIKSYQASNTIEAYHFVKFSDEKSVETANAATDNIIGATDSTKTIEGDIADIFLPGEIVLVQAGGTFSAGDALTSDENGCAIKANPGDNIGAIALQNAAQNDVIQAIVAINRTITVTATEENTEIQGGQS